MRDEKVLTREIAEEFLADADSVDLSEFTAIEDAAAESLSKYEGELNLRGLTELSDAAAGHLAKHPNLVIQYGDLPESAAQILRDAGHG